MESQHEKLKEQLVVIKTTALTHNHGRHADTRRTARPKGNIRTSSIRGKLKGKGGAANDHSGVTPSFLGRLILGVIPSPLSLSTIS